MIQPMAQRRFHYDQAFEHYLRSRQIPYVAVDEAKKALHGAAALKSFDFVVYGQTGANLLVDVKGRKHSGRSRRSLDNWVTQEDVADLEKWQEVFGSGFRAALVFLYWCEAQPPDALFHEIFCFKDRWYAVLAVAVDEYRRHMTVRSPRWNTVHVPAAAFDRLACPLAQIL
jgi:hypothetical protein